ncbi:MAG: hypothetical protein CME65_03810 [Halobacteriovoraceae bacterium]|nr:hypothetical protein [Halobacteriovoraceae bacterium]|tara:strand:+ start:6297 stop:6512 length:216 start_codon:yes stop_codon:yes gene_type:complete
MEDLKSFFEKLSDMESEQLMSVVEAHLSNDEIELFVDHIEDFYGVEDDEELGMLAQIMITGFLAAKQTQQN